MAAAYTARHLVLVVGRLATITTVARHVLHMIPFPAIYHVPVALRPAHVPAAVVQMLRLLLVVVMVIWMWMATDRPILVVVPVHRRPVITVPNVMMIAR